MCSEVCSVCLLYPGNASLFIFFWDAMAYPSPCRKQASLSLTGLPPVDTAFFHHQRQLVPNTWGEHTTQKGVNILAQNVMVKFSPQNPEYWEKTGICEIIFCQKMAFLRNVNFLEPRSQQNWVKISGWGILKWLPFHVRTNHAIFEHLSFDFKKWVPRSIRFRLT